MMSLCRGEGPRVYIGEGVWGILQQVKKGLSSTKVLIKSVGVFGGDRAGFFVFIVDDPSKKVCILHSVSREVR